MPTPAIEGSLATIPYQLPHFSAQATGLQPCLLAPEELETRLGLAGSATNHRKLRWALNRAVPGSASPREPKLVLRLSLQSSLGGYGLAAAGIAEYRVDKDLYKNLGYIDSLVEQIRTELGMPREHLSRRQREQRRKLRLELFDEVEEIDGVTWDGRARERDRRKAGIGATPPQDPVEGDVVPLEAYGV